MLPKRHLARLASHLALFCPVGPPVTNVSPFLQRTMSVQVGDTAITRQFLQGVRDIWFEGLDEERLVPPETTTMRWWMKSEAFDGVCRSHAHPILTATITTPPSIPTLLQTFPHPLDRVALVILFDQMPRNLYRGADSTIVYTHFDKLALPIALDTVSSLFPSSSQPQTQSVDETTAREMALVRSNLAYRMWLYVPHMHSEDIKLHEQAVEGYEAARGDMEEVERTGEMGGRKFTKEEAKEGLEYVKFQKGFGEKHLEIVRRFGRYPHRNKLLGRESTREEVEYLEGGGETFGQ